MVDNQHKVIKGYRDLTAEEIMLINACKQLANDVGKQIISLEGIPSVDKRWLAIAKTDLQKGFMSLVRAIAKPESF